MKIQLRQALKMLRDILIPAIIYSAIIFLVTHFLPSIKNPWYETFKLMNSPAFYAGLAFLIIYIILQNTLSKRIKQKISLYMLLAVTVIILCLGVSFIMLSYNKPLWENLSYNLNAFGVGVSMAALGFAFLFAFSLFKSRQADNEPKNTGNELDRKIKKLSKEASKIEYSLKECKSLIEELRELKEEQDTKTKDSD